MRKVACGTPMAQCSGGFIPTSHGLENKPFKVHSTHAEAKNCYTRWRLRSGYTRVDSRLLQAPTGECEILTKQCRFGTVLRRGKGLQGNNMPRVMPSKRHGGFIV